MSACTGQSRAAAARGVETEPAHALLRVRGVVQAGARRQNRARIRLMERVKSGTAGPCTEGVSVESGAGRQERACARSQERARSGGRLGGGKRGSAPLSVRGASRASLRRSVRGAVEGAVRQKAAEAVQGGGGAGRRERAHAHSQERARGRWKVQRRRGVENRLWRRRAAAVWGAESEPAHARRARGDGRLAGGAGH